MNRAGSKPLGRKLRPALHSPTPQQHDEGTCGAACALVQGAGGEERRRSHIGHRLRLGLPAHGWHLFRLPRETQDGFLGIFGFLDIYWRVLFRLYRMTSKEP